jgi:hypothetical protein
VEYLTYLSFINEFILKTTWCMQHFLTMEFYRKICNKCYWNNIYSSRQSKTKKIFILTVSFISLMFLSFFYLPTDPANSNRSSYYLKVIDFLSGFKICMKNILNCISNQIIIFSNSVINLRDIVFYNPDIINTNSSLLI